LAKYISGVRREDFQDYEGYLQALHRSGEPVPDHVLCGSGGGFRGELLRGIYGHQKFGDTVMAEGRRPRR
jgi:hypothetical protein